MPESVNHIRQAIIDQMNHLGMTRYRLAKELRDIIPSLTNVYGFLDGQNDISTDRLARMLRAVDLHLRHGRRRPAKKPVDAPKGR